MGNNVNLSEIISNNEVADIVPLPGNLAYGAPAPWEDTVILIISIIVGVSLISFVVLSILMIINKFRHKKIEIKMIGFWVASIIIFILAGTTPIIYDILIEIFKTIYGY